MPQTGHPVSPREAAPARVRTTASIAGLAAVALGVVTVLLPAPYIVEAPGPTFNTIGEYDGESVITVDGAPTFPTEGNLDLTTVYVSGPPTSTTTFGEVAFAWAVPSAQLIPSELVYPSDATGEQVSEQNAAAMATSQDWAIAAALENLDIDYRQELFVSDFAPESAAAEVLELDDRLLGADGQEVTGLQGLKQQLDASGGEPVELQILREGEPLTVEAPVYRGANGEWLLGVYLDSTFDFPLEVDISLEGVGGPSAGLMFALGIIDELTPGAMTGGRHIAGTGTIDPDGTVGAIGGIHQKVTAAEEEGAEVFLAPAGNCAELAGSVPEGITVYPVETLDQARTVVEAVGQGQRPEGINACG